MTTSRDFTLVIHPAEEGGFWAEVPALDGCFVQGETIDEVLTDAPAAIASHLDALRADGDRSLPASVVVATVTVSLAA
jgi:predicted RNase H-like HicB family nuclease